MFRDTKNSVLYFVFFLGGGGGWGGALKGGFVCMR